MFWRKEVWRGTGNLKGVYSHGVRWDEIPSVGFPIYILCVSSLTSLGMVVGIAPGHLWLLLLSLGLLIIPSLILSVNTIWSARKFS